MHPTKLLKQHLEGLQLSPEEVKDALALHKFQNEHYTDGAKILGGGRIRIAQRILSDIQEMRKRLESLADSINGPINAAEREVLVREELKLRRAYETAIDQYVKVAKHVEQGALGWAAIEAQHKAIEADVSKPRSGWKPLRVTNIESNPPNGE